jgi:hypothetical protein
MSINETSQQFVEALAGSFFTDVIKQVQTDAVNAIQNKLADSDLGAILQEQIYQAVIDHFDQTLKQNVNTELEKKLAELDITHLISREIAENLIPELQKQNWVAAEITSSLAQINYDGIVREQTNQAVALANTEITKTISDRLNLEIESRLEDLDIVALLTQEVSEKLIPRLEQQNRDRVASDVSAGLANINLNDIVRQQAEVAVKNLITTFSFPASSIPGSAVDTRSLIVSAENISGGIFKNLQSTGIQDSASQCQVTILDTATVFENRLVAGGLEIAGEMTVHRDAVFKGNVIIEGTVKEDALATIQNRMKDVDVANLLQENISEIIINQFSTSIKENINNEIKSKLDQLDIISLINKEVVDKLIPEFERQNKDRVAEDIAVALTNINLNDIVRQQSNAAVKDIVESFTFPDWSIPSKAVDPRELIIPADNINGGVFKAFESTGIQDRATQCQITLQDDNTVVENKLIAQELHVVGAITIEKDAVFKGNVTVEGVMAQDSAFVKQIVDIVADHFNKKYEDGTFDQYTDRVFMRIAEEGIDASIVLVGQNPVVDFGGTLAPTVVNSNLQSVGALKELQVIGETLLDQTLYVSNKRVGINTIEPERALDLWDQEVQIIAGKRQKDTAIFGTIRDQNLIISANGKEQLTVGSDGSVTVKNVNIGRTNHSSAPRMPTDNRPMGHIVWNENPAIGAPIGWVSLGGARWSAFGLIAG